MTDEEHAQGPGRRADRGLADRVLDAVLDELATSGRAGLSTDRIARRAHVSKASLYARWRSKEDLLLAAYRHVANDFPAIDTGSLAGDLDVLWAVFVVGAADRRYTVTMSELIAAAATDERMRAELHRVQRSWREGIRGLLDAARARGELAADVDVDVLAEVLQSLSLVRGLVSDLPVDDELRRRVDTLVFRSPPRR